MREISLRRPDPESPALFYRKEVYEELIVFDLGSGEEEEQHGPSPRIPAYSPCPYAQQEPRRPKVVEVKLFAKQPPEGMPALETLERYETFNPYRYGSPETHGCLGCPEHTKAWHPSSSEPEKYYVADVCLDPECFKAQAYADRKTKAVRTAHAEEVKRAALEGAGAWDRDLLLFLAAAVLEHPPYSQACSRDRVEKAVCARYGWPVPRGLWGEKRQRAILERLQTLPDRDLYWIIACCLLKPAESTGFLFGATLGRRAPEVTKAFEERPLFDRRALRGW